MLLGERNVVDPMRVSLDLCVEGGNWLWPAAVGSGGVDDGGFATALVLVQVPGADNAVTPTRVSETKRSVRDPVSIMELRPGRGMYSHRIALSRSMARPLTPSRWPPGEALGSSRTGCAQVSNKVLAKPWLN
jgi:hypothetical protein